MEVKVPRYMIAMLQDIKEYDEAYDEILFYIKAYCEPYSNGYLTAHLEAYGDSFDGEELLHTFIKFAQRFVKEE